MRCLSMGKRLAVAAVAAAALAGPVTAAHALQFNAGDMVLAVYGNGNEYVADIGTIASVLNNGVDVNLSSFLGTGTGQIGPVGSLQYTVFGYTGTTTTSNALFGNVDALGVWAGDQSANTPSALITALVGYKGALVNAADTRTIFPQNDALSFSTNLNNAGDNTLGGNISSSHTAAANIDTVLNLLEQTKNGATFTQVGTGFLSSQTGHFVVSAVPVPAAVVLFATGVIGLVGLARRKMSGAQPDAA